LKRIKEPLDRSDVVAMLLFLCQIKGLSKI
jgi:hypothetical protein